MIGTGATAVQCVPHLARACRELLVFQRTPSSVDVRANVPIDPEWFAQIATPGWQQRWLENFTANHWSAGGGGSGAGRLDRPVAPHPQDLELPREDDAAEYAGGTDSDYEDGRDQRDGRQRPRDGETLKAWYRQLCKAVFTTLSRRVQRPARVDRRRQGVERITEAACGGGVEYAVDCIIYASGFEWARPTGARDSIHGARRLEVASTGPRAAPAASRVRISNAFLVQPTQGASLTNVPQPDRNREDHRDGDPPRARYRRQPGGSRSGNAWIELLLTGQAAVGSLIARPVLQQRRTGTGTRRAPRRRSSGGTMSSKPSTVGTSVNSKVWSSAAEQPNGPVEGRDAQSAGLRRCHSVACSYA